MYSARAETEEDKVFPVMLLTYMLLLQEFVLWSVRCFTWIEKRMVNVDRCLKILDIPQEEAGFDKKQMKKLKKRKNWPETGTV